MSTAPKGYPSTQKLDRITADYASVTPVSANQNGLAVNASIYVYQVGIDAVDAGSSTSKIVAAGIGAVALRGDLIRFTSGALSGLEVAVDSVGTNDVTLVQDLSVAPTALDTFAIMRFIHPVATSSGGVPTTLSFTRNGINQVVTEDTVNPANNRPLPVQIESTSGAVTINAGDLDVNINHDGANYSSVRIGDGTTLVGVTTANELKVKATTFAGRSKANAPTYYDYAVPVTTAAYTQLVAATSLAINRLQIFDSSGEALYLATGAAGAEVDLMVITPGGLDIDLAIPAGTRISIKAISANATAGFNVINYLT